MTFRRHHLIWLAIAFFAIVIAVVFQQIHTDMAEQGIASGGPYDNAAAYPQAIAVLIGLLLFVQLVLTLLTRERGQEADDVVALSSLARPVAMLAVFAVYLGVLNWLGYHLTTPPMIFAVMAIAGMRRWWVMIVAAVALSLGFAFLFEFFLKIVLPGGIFRLNISW